MKNLRVSFVVVALYLALTSFPVLVSLDSVILIIDVLTLTLIDVLALKSWLCTRWLI